MGAEPKTVRLTLPLSESAVRELRAGDFVTLTGTIHTARDAVHRYLAQGGPPPCDLTGGVFYHCGPVVIREGNGWRLTAAGPTTSSREEPYMPAIVGQYRLRGIIGKGGMGRGTLAACREFGCVYLHAVGGAAQVLAAHVQGVTGVYFYDLFGAPEAMWQLVVAEFPALVTMDAHGVSLHDQVESESRSRLARLLASGV